LSQSNLACYLRGRIDRHHEPPGDVVSPQPSGLKLNTSDLASLAAAAG